MVIGSYVTFSVTNTFIDNFQGWGSLLLQICRNDTSITQNNTPGENTTAPIPPGTIPWPLHNDIVCH